MFAAWPRVRALTSVTYLSLRPRHHPARNQVSEVRAARATEQMQGPPPDLGSV